MGLAQDHAVRSECGPDCAARNSVSQDLVFEKCQPRLPPLWPAHPAGFAQATVTCSDCTGLVSGIHSTLKPEPSVRCTATDKHPVWLLVLSVISSQITLDDPTTLLSISCNFPSGGDTRAAPCLRPGLAASVPRGKGRRR